MTMAGVEERSEKAAADSESRGQNSRGQGCGASTVRAGKGDSPPETLYMMEAVVDRENMVRAYSQVKGNKGSAGANGLSVEGLGPYLKENWPQIKEELLSGRYEPRDVGVRRVDIPKPGARGCGNWPSRRSWTD